MENLPGIDTVEIETGSAVSCCRCGLFAEDMGMAADELAVEAVGYVFDGEVSGFGGHLRVEKHLQQKVAELVFERGPVAALDGVEDLVGLLKRVFADRVEALLAVPGAAAGRAETLHDGHGLSETSRGVLTGTVV